MFLQQTCLSVIESQNISKPNNSYPIVTVNSYYCFWNSVELFDAVRADHTWWCSLIWQGDKVWHYCQGETFVSYSSIFFHFCEDKMQDLCRFGPWLRPQKAPFCPICSWNGIILVRLGSKLAYLSHSYPNKRILLLASAAVNIKDLFAAILSVFWTKRSPLLWSFCLYRDFSKLLLKDFSSKRVSVTF